MHFERYIFLYYFVFLTKSQKLKQTGKDLASYLHYNEKLPSTYKIGYQYEIIHVLAFKKYSNRTELLP